MENQTLETQEEIQDVIVELEKQKKNKSISDKIDLLKIKLKQIISKSEQKKKQAQTTDEKYLKILRSQSFIDKLNQLTDEEIEEIGLF